MGLTLKYKQQLKPKDCRLRPSAPALQTKKTKSETAAGSTPQKGLPVSMLYPPFIDNKNKPISAQSKFRSAFC